MLHANDLSADTDTNSPAAAGEAVKAKLAGVADAAREGLDKAERSAAELTDKAAHAMREAARRMREIGKGDIADTLLASARQVQGRAAGLADDVRDVVVEHPMKTVAIAAGVGALVALLLKSNRS